MKKKMITLGLLLGILITSFSDNLKAYQEINDEIIASFNAIGITSDYDIIAYVNADITPEAVAPFIRQGVTSQYDIRQYIGADITPEAVTSFIRQGVRSRHDIIKYVEADITPEAAAPFVQLGVTKQYDISAYLKADVTSEAVASFIRQGVTNSYDTIQYVKADVTPEEVLLITHNGKKTLYSFQVISYIKAFRLRGINKDDYIRYTVNRPVYSLYPTGKLSFVPFDDLDTYQSDSEVTPLPEKLFLDLNGPYHLSNDVSLDEQNRILNQLSHQLTAVPNPTVHQLLTLAADIVADQISYEDVDTNAYDEIFPRGCSLYRYWEQKIGDCDKYTGLYSLVFSLLKQLYPDILGNVYVGDARFGIAPRHAWNTIVIAEKDRLIITYVDVTWYDTTNTLYSFFYGNSDYLNALDSKHFDRDTFLEGYQKAYFDEKSSDEAQ